MSYGRPNVSQHAPPSFLRNVGDAVPIQHCILSRGDVHLAGSGCETRSVGKNRVSDMESRGRGDGRREGLAGEWRGNQATFCEVIWADDAREAGGNKRRVPKLYVTLLRLLLRPLAP